MLFADFMKLQLIFTGTLHNIHSVLTHLYAKVFSCRHNSSHEVDCGVYMEFFCVLLTEISRSIPLEVFLGKSVLKICCKFAGEHPCESVISVKLLRNLNKNLPEPILVSSLCAK